MPKVIGVPYPSKKIADLSKESFNPTLANDRIQQILVDATEKSRPSEKVNSVIVSDLMDSIERVSHSVNRALSEQQVPYGLYTSCILIQDDIGISRIIYFTKKLTECSFILVNEDEDAQIGFGLALEISIHLCCAAMLPSQLMRYLATPMPMSSLVCHNYRSIRFDQSTQEWNEKPLVVTERLTCSDILQHRRFLASGGRIQMVKYFRQEEAELIIKDKEQRGPSIWVRIPKKEILKDKKIQANRQPVESPLNASGSEGSRSPLRSVGIFSTDVSSSSEVAASSTPPSSSARKTDDYSTSSGIISQEEYVPIILNSCTIL